MTTFNIDKNHKIMNVITEEKIKAHSEQLLQTI